MSNTETKPTTNEAEIAEKIRIAGRLVLKQAYIDELVFYKSHLHKGKIAPAGKLFYIMREPQKSGRRYANLLLPAVISEKDLAEAKQLLIDALTT